MGKNKRSVCQSSLSSAIILAMGLDDLTFKVRFCALLNHTLESRPAPFCLNFIAFSNVFEATCLLILCVYSFFDLKLSCLDYF